MQRIEARTACAAAILGIVLVIGAIGAEQPSAEAEAAAEGEQIYRIYCQSCHGATGRGDGPSAEVLRVPPADLTGLQADNDGEFPAERVYRSIDGRGEIRGHGTRAMPIWGLAFQQPDRDVNQEAEVRSRIERLVAYLRTIQR
jgi:mono/diheme cytochrome c family protein